MAIKKEPTLLPDTENPNSFSARLFKWLTTVGRWVIIITEFIVISAFISRFWLDRKNSDLSETIRQQQAILSSTNEFINEFNSFQERLKMISDFYQQQPQYSKYIQSLVNSVPQDILFDNFSIRSNQSTHEVQASASLIAFNETSIVNFITNLSVNPDVKSVDINKIEKTEKSENYSISVSVVFKNSVSKT